MKFKISPPVIAGALAAWWFFFRKPAEAYGPMLPANTMLAIPGNVYAISNPNRDRLGLPPEGAAPVFEVISVAGDTVQLWSETAERSLGNGIWTVDRGTFETTPGDLKRGPIQNGGTSPAAPIAPASPDELTMVGWSG